MAYAIELLGATTRAMDLEAVHSGILDDARDRVAIVGKVGGGWEESGGAGGQGKR